MKILVVAATKFEVLPLLNQMSSVSEERAKLIPCRYNNLEIDFLITGIGMVAAAYYTGKILDETYDAAFNVGICGSFNRNLEIGSVVNVYEDCISEMGAQDDTQFLSLHELNLEGITTVKNINYGALNQTIELLPRVNGITVNTVHGNDEAILRTFHKFHPTVETMEGAAFMFACENENIPYAQLRAVSNYVERRNKDAWNIPLAIENLNKTVLEIFNSL